LNAMSGSRCLVMGRSPLVVDWLTMPASFAIGNAAFQYICLTTATAWTTNPGLLASATAAMFGWTRVSSCVSHAANWCFDRLKPPRRQGNRLIRGFPPKAVIKLRTTIGPSGVGALNNAFCPPSVGRWVRHRDLSYPLVVMREGPWRTSPRPHSCFVGGGSAVVTGQQEDPAGRAVFYETATDHRLAC
jgi:hypothetical protein